MPALVLLGQPTIVSGDDIRWICILLILLRLLQLAVVIPFLFYVINFSNHPNDNGTTTISDYSECIQEKSFSRPLVSKARLVAISYGALTLFLAVASIVLESFIWRASLLGTPTQPEKRQALKCLCFFKLVPGSLLRIVTMFLGLVSIFILKEFCECQLGESDNHAHHNADLLLRGLCGGNFYRVRLLLIILTISHMTEVCLAAFIHLFILFTSARGKFHVFQLARRCMIQTLCCGMSEGASNNNMDGSGWRCFCSCCFTLTSLLTCCFLGGRQAATADFRDISMALVAFLDDGGHLDVTISDVFCALVVLHKQHQEQRYAHIHRIRSQIMIELSSRQYRHHQQNRGMNNDSNDAAAAAAGVEPSGTRLLGAGRLENGDNEQVVDLEVVMLTDSKGGSNSDTKNSQQQQQDDNDVERGKPEPVHQQARAPTMFRWTLQREDNHNNFRVNSTHYQQKERTLLSPSDAFAKQTIAAGAHFMHFALAIYGPSLIPVARPCQGSLCFLGWDACCTTPCRRRRQRRQRRHTNSSNNDNPAIEVIGDNPCACNENTLLREANLTMDDVAYAAFHSSVDKNPYCIIIDRPWKSIVVAIRGSWSLESIVTDLSLAPVRLVTGQCDDKAAITDDENTSSRQVYCHSGMLQTAQWMYKDLQRHGILDKLLLEGGNAPYADYRLVLTGHSLGAGLASILAIMLRPKFPTLKCFCFAPPGCTLSDNALEATRVAAPSPSKDSSSMNDADNNNTDVDAENEKNEDDDFITSYVVGSDIIPRMSLEAMESLQDDVLETLSRIKVNKLQAMGGGGRGYWGGPEKASSSLEVSDLIHREDESIPRTKFNEQLLAFWAHQASVREAIPIGIVKLHPPPGKIVHFVKTTTRSTRRLADSIRASADFASNGPSSSFTAIWAERPDFSEIQLSASMWGNHNSKTALAIMENIATEQFGLQAPYFVPE